MDPEQTQELCRLFVYGSLKRGLAHHQELGQARFVSVARTLPCFALRIIDGYPALVSGARSVRGELFQVAVDGLAALDEFEGEGYQRVEIELAAGGRAFAYVSRSPAAGRLHAADEWPELE